MESGRTAACHNTVWRQSVSPLQCLRWRKFLSAFRECAAAIVEPRLKKNWPGSITFRSRARRLKKVLTIRFNPQTQQGWLDALQWGLIPYWAKDPKIAYRTINARAETVDRAPSFRKAFAKRRCLIPADGFYEWRKTAKPEAAVRDRHERRTALHLCGSMGRMERSRIWRVAAHLHNYHSRS